MRRLIFRVPRKDHYFDNNPYGPQFRAWGDSNPLAFVWGLGLATAALLGSEAYASKQTLRSKTA